jgi:hypothetical protein
MPEFKLTRFELENTGVTIEAGESAKVTVLFAKAKRLFVEDTHFHTDSSVFLPRGPSAAGSDISAERKFANDAFWEAIRKNNVGYVETAKDGEFIPPDEEPVADEGITASKSAGGLEDIFAALQFLDANPDYGVLVAGHTDRAGSDAYNLELSAARAECVCAVLEGDRAAYVKAAKKHHPPESDGSMLVFAARSEGIPCEPANAKKPSVAEIKAFQKGYNDRFGKSIAVDGEVGDETRGAYFDILDAELARSAGDTEALKTLRGKVKFADANKKLLACGEKFPIENPSQDGLASQANRRVELLFFPPELKPDLNAKDAPERIYHKGTFDFEKLDPGIGGSVSDAGSGEEEQLVIADAAAPEEGVGEMEGELETEMARLQEEADPEDQYAFLDPFDFATPEFGRQAGDFPLPDGGAVLV